MRLSKGLVALLGGLLACGASVANGDLIVNGSFDSHGGFQSDYQIVVLDNSRRRKANMDWLSSQQIGTSISPRLAITRRPIC